MKAKKLSIFNRVGLGGREELMYKTLLSGGPRSISELSRRTGIPRVNIYASLPRLLSHGFVAQSPKGKYKVYYAEAPKKLNSMLNDIIAESELEIEELEEMAEKSGKRPKVTYAEGAKAIRQVYSDGVHSLKKGGIYYRYSSSSDLKREESLKKYLPTDYRKLRDEKELERLVITNETTKNRKKPAFGREVKAVPRDYDLFEYNITLTIYGDKVSIIDYNSESVITIENHAMAKFQKKIFKLLFRKL